MEWIPIAVGIAGLTAGALGIVGYILKRNGYERAAAHVATVEDILRGITGGLREAQEVGKLDKSAVLDDFVKPALERLGVRHQANELLARLGTKIKDVTAS